MAAPRRGGTGGWEPTRPSACVGIIAINLASTYALTNVTLPYAVALADDWRGALAADPGLALGLNVHDGQVTHRAVAAAHGLPYVPLS